MKKALMPVLVKTALPAALGVLGTLAALAYNEGFRAFCGL
jgi:hypothetical protein